MSTQTNDNDINGFIFKYSHDPLFTKVVEYVKDNPDVYKNIKKFIENRQIMSKCSTKLIADVLNDIIDNKGSEILYEKICSLVNEAYGEKALNILKDRPWISLNDIPNFNIFDERIVNIIGNGGVHSFLTFIMKSEKVITEMCENPKLIEQYIEFKKMTEGYFPNSAIGLEESLNAFYSHKDLINELIESGLQEELRDDLLLLFRDEETVGIIDTDYGIDKSAKNTFFASNVEELKMYRKKRNGFFNQLITEIEEKGVGFPKKLLLLKHFGSIRNCPGNYDQYDHEKFLTDYLMFKKSYFSEDEIDLIQLYSIIEKCKDEDVLLKIFELLDQREDIVDPVKMKSIDEKVVESYKQEYVDGLLQIEEAREKVADVKDSSYMYLIKPNGDKVYKDHRLSQGKEYYSDYIKSGDDIIREYQDDYWQHISKTVEQNGKTRYEATKVDDENPDNNKKMKVEVLPDGKKVYEYTYNSGNYTIKKEESGKYVFEYSSESDEVTKIIFDEKKGSGDFKIINTKSGRCIMDGGFSFDVDYTTGKSPYGKRQKQISEMAKKSVDYTPIFEQFLDTFCEEVDKLHPKKQFDEKEFEKSDNDIEVFHLIEIDRSKLCVTEFRKNTYSDPLSKNDRVKNKFQKNGDSHSFIGTDNELVEIDRQLEGGISYRSLYYDYNGGQGNEGLGFSNMNPNSIIGLWDR